MRWCSLRVRIMIIILTCVNDDDDVKEKQNGKKMNSYEKCTVVYVRCDDNLSLSAVAV